MKISELKQPYRDLAEMRREQFKNGDWCKRHEHHFESTNEISCAFMWAETPEDALWLSINSGDTPDIPSSSLAELEAWRKAKQEANKPETWGKQLYDSGQFHDLLTKYENAEPDYKGLYEQLQKEHEELANEYEEYLERNKQTPSRNWVAECAIAFVSTKGLGFEDAWDWAEQWAAEGKRRGHI